ncbi:PREDICTED: subtilisin-like protease SBT3.9 [Ipomoea nil]|uniref:subtilisin-like protease SBT3.9 n=1 Tax=Ipomoea nil TaxID=35883 RepID=UPI000901FF0A|nr:PREDICTED: subtilisin-like protease SBT3.9 [Ipomoea nil]
MYKPTPFLSVIFFLSLIFVNGHCRSVGTNAKVLKENGKKIYIVYLGGKPHDDHRRIKESHYDLLAGVVGSHEEARKAMVYSYRYGFSGFAAVLTASQAKKVAGVAGVVSVVEDKHHKVQTSRSWDFLGLSEGANVPGELLRKTNKGDGMIVGVVDSGISTELPSFGDAGMGPVPQRWKGSCRAIPGLRFNESELCNRKVIGARWFFKGALLSQDVDLNKFLVSDSYSGYDVAGHGSQVASIVAGSFVPNATTLGIDVGMVRGGATAARVASYKACWNLDPERFVCAGADLLAAIDYAIHDRVDVISVSVGSPVPLASDMEAENGIGIGSFHAITRGIPVIVAAGNAGPSAFTITNVEPWVITVAASTIDRIFAYTITLGNGEKYAVDWQLPNGTALSHPLHFAGKYMGEADLMPRKLDPAEVKGKIVFMFGDDLDRNLVLVDKATDAGAVGVIYSNPSNVDSLPILNARIPYVQVDYDAGTRIKDYIFQSTMTPTAQLSSPKIQVGRALTPKVPDFSSRGPSSFAPGIMKPDIAAPGDKIMCADPTSDGGFRISSGTSHAAPHVSAIVALLKISHPEWSPAAIKSALVTTAWNSDTYFSPIFAKGSSLRAADAFDYGGGIVNPNAADDPGLVYDMRGIDYAQYLCALGYNNSLIYKTISGNRNRSDTEEHTICPKTRPSMLDLNLPSMVVPDLFKPVTLRRTVTNVGPVNSVYKAIVKSPVGAVVTVKPKVLRFDGNRKKRSFTMRVSADKLVNSAFTFGSLTWSDGVHNVRTPIAVRKMIVPLYL